MIPLRQIYHKIKIYPFKLPQDDFKKRKYDNDYHKFGFIKAVDKGHVVPKCVIYLENLSNVALRPSRLQRHLRAKLPDLQDKNSEFLNPKKSCLKERKL